MPTLGEPEIAKPAPVTKSFNDVSMNPAMAKFLAKAEVVEEEPEVEDWRFDPKFPPNFPDAGGVYRLQRLAPAFKKSRQVEVDEFNHDLILRVV